MTKRKPFGGSGKTYGLVHEDLMGTVRRSPDGTMLAILWPSPPHPGSWHVTDHHGALGYEIPDRVAHWPVIGGVPGTPAAGVCLLTYEQAEVSDQRAERRKNFVHPIKQSGTST